MSNFVLIGFSGLGLGSLYFLLASGLSLILGLMRVLSFAHGAFLTVSGYVAWLIMAGMGGGSTGELICALMLATLAGGVLACIAELTIIRPLQGRTVEQLLVTVGLGTALVALLQGIWGPDEQLLPLPEWVTSTTIVAGASVPNNRFLLVVAALVVLVAIKVFLARTRHGLIIRAGVENSEMVSALGIDVKRSFTLVFTLGGMGSGLAGGLAACYFRTVSPYLGDNLLIFSFIVLIIGGLGSIGGAMIAALVLGMVQSFANFYVASGLGDILVVALLAVTLLVRPQGLVGRKERLA